MLKELKRIFCSHIWKIENDVQLNRTKTNYTASIVGNYFNKQLYLEPNVVQLYARNEVCVKCGRKKVTEIEKDQ